MPSLCRGGPRRFVTWLVLWTALVTGITAWRGSSAAEPAKSARIPWTTSRVVGSPDPPPPFRVVRAFPELKFDPQPRESGREG
jgi:hypothetical protein